MPTFLATVFVIICVLLIVVVLLQKGRGVGLGGAFGGAGSSAFGTRTGDVFTWVTIVLVCVFLLLSVGTALYFRPLTSQVSTPVLPPSRTIAKRIPVSITCGTPKADIYFTTATDASQPPDPTRRSEKYDAPIWVEPGTTVKARAFLAGWVDSEVATASYMAPAAATAGATRPGAATATAPARAVTGPAETMPGTPTR